jgi:predicted PurR-regulated permease PerM
MKDNGSYQAPPRKWPFPALGRNAFLAVGALLLAFILLPFWGAISVAAVFAFGLSQPFEKLNRRCGNRRRLTAALVVGVLTVLLFFPAALLGLRVYEMATAPKEQSAFSARTLEQIDATYKKVESLAIKYGVGARIFESGRDAQESIRNGASAMLAKLVEFASAAVASLPELTVTLLVFALFVYVFLAHSREIRRFAFRLHLFRPEDLKRSIKILRASSYESLVANALVGALQASIITIGAAALGYHEHVLIFSVVFVISYIPFIGAAPVGYAIALLMLVNEGSGPALIMAAVATVTGVVDNLARPYFVSGGEGEVHPALSFAAILGAIGILGLKGIFLGPVILTSTVAFLGASTGAKKKEKKSSGGVVKFFRGLTSRAHEAKAAPSDKLAS